MRVTGSGLGFGARGVGCWVWGSEFGDLEGGGPVLLRAHVVVDDQGVARPTAPRGGFRGSMYTLKRFSMYIG